MNGKYLLDTNIIIALFADELVVKEKFAQASQVFIPSIVFGELFYGARKSTRVESNSNLAKINELSSQSRPLNCDIETAQYYGDIKNKLRLKGRPIPENDIWIAALAVQHTLILISRDAHFQTIENLITQIW